MDLLQLEYFIATAKYKNFTTAAKEFYISQPCISHKIKSLERELGVSLFTRNTRNVELTNEGELFLQDAIQAVDLLRRSQHKLQQNNESLMKLTIGHLAAATKPFLPNVIQEFKRLHPNIRINLYRKNATELYHDAKNETYDIYFSIAHDLMSLNTLASKNVQMDSYCLVTSKNHPTTQHLALDYETLATEPFVFMDPARASTLYKDAHEICKQMGFTPHVVSTYPLYEDVLFAVEAGIGVFHTPLSFKGVYV